MQKSAIQRAVDRVLVPPQMPVAERAFREGWEFGSFKGVGGKRPKGKTTQELLAKLNETPLPPDPIY